MKWKLDKKKYGPFTEMLKPQTCHVYNIFQFLPLVYGFLTIFTRSLAKTAFGNEEHGKSWGL